MASKTLGIVVAMDAELVHLLRAYPAKKTADVDGWSFHHLEIGGREVIALRSGMGLINAAAGTERLFAEYRPEAILNFGCSGAHRPYIMPGDLVLADRVVHHSAMRVLADGREVYTGFGYETGGEKMDAAELTTDPAWLAAAKDLAAAFQPEPWPVEAGWPDAIPHRRPVMHVGAVASADIWTQAIDRLDVLHARHQTLCEDMEAAAVAQIAARHGVPFFSVKDISNNEYLKASDLDAFSDFPVAEIGKRAAAFTAALIERMDNEKGAGS
jgi:adenosylhomocysteine nucleosidase